MTHTEMTGLHGSQSGQMARWPKLQAGVQMISRRAAQANKARWEIMETGKWEERNHVVLVRIRQYSLKTVSKEQKTRKALALSILCNLRFTA